jgi:hypothetical protein
LAEASYVLRNFDDVDDIECNIAFCRDGTIEEYTIDDGIIDSEAELNAVFAVAQDVTSQKHLLLWRDDGSCRL